MAETPDHPERMGSQRDGEGWGELSTEASNPESAELDTLSTTEVVALLLEEDRRGLEIARQRSDGIARAASWAAETLEAGGEILFAGAGTSGRLGILEAAECPPTFGSDPKQIQAVIAGGLEATFAAREGAEDIAEDGAQAAGHLGEGDLLIAISASSVTPYVVGALKSARENGARAILLTCASADKVSVETDLLLALDTGPEVLTGSTRLKAGSATKAVLNAITTAAMVRLGKVYRNFMVDLRPGSAKLQDRTLRIIKAAGEVCSEEARRLHDEAEGEVKTAIVMAHCSLGADEARERLRSAGGNVRKALEGQTTTGNDEFHPS